MFERLEQIMTASAADQYLIHYETYKSNDADQMDILIDAGAFNVRSDN